MPLSSQKMNFSPLITIWKLAKIFTCRSTLLGNCGQYFGWWHFLDAWCHIATEIKFLPVRPIGGAIQIYVEWLEMPIMSVMNIIRKLESFFNDGSIFALLHYLAAWNRVLPLLTSRRDTVRVFTEHWQRVGISVEQVKSLLWHTVASEK